MRIFNCGKWVNIEIGTAVFIGQCGGGKTVFGEYGTVSKFLKNHIVIETQSGAKVKVDDSFNTVGKAARNDYWVSLNTNRPNYIPSNVKYWNSEKLCFEYK